MSGTTGSSGDARETVAGVSTAWWPTAVVMLLACLPYAETPWFEFVDYDDPDHVAGHAIVGPGITARGVAWAFGLGADPTRDGWFNWPLTWLSHMTDATLFGSWAGGHHLINVLLHVANAALVLSLARRLGLGRSGALFVSAVFAVHPAQVESVAWVSERKTVLCAALMLLSALAYMRWRDVITAEAAFGSGRRGLAWLLGWNVLGGLALLAKPLAVTLPCVLLLVDAIPLRRVRGARPGEQLASLARCISEKLPLFTAVVATCLWTISSQAAAGAVQQLPLATRLAHAAVAYATYVRLSAWPTGLGCFHPHPGLPTPTTFITAAATVLALSAIVTGATRRGWPLPLFGWLWFLGTLVPMIGVIQVGGNGFSDRYLYVPIIGLAMVAASLAEWGICGTLTTGDDHRPGESGPARRTAATLVSTAWIVTLAVLAWRQAATWRDTRTLATASVAASPTSAEAWNMLAVHQARMRDVRAAEGSFRSAIMLAASPVRRADHTVNLGRLFLDVGRDADAARAFAAAVATVPRHLAGRRGLGVALTRIGAADQAVVVFRGLVTDNPGDADAWVGLGNALYRLGHAAEAAASYGSALALDPNDGATLVNRAWARLEAGDRDGALADVNAAERLGGQVDAALLSRTRGSQRALPPATRAEEPSRSPD